MQDKVLSMIGLAVKAGQCVSGAFAAEKSIKDMAAKLIIISIDASDNTRKHFNDMCSYRGIPIREYGTMDSLGRAVGKDSRAVVAILNEGFSNKLISVLREVEI